MISSRLVDKTDKCNIIQTSLKDDLYPYTISSDGSTINYSNVSAPPRINQPIAYNGLDAIGTLAIQSYASINDNGMADCWLPVIVDNDTFVNNKMLSDDGSYSNSNPTLPSGRLGIENFLSFMPSFRNFSNVGEMSIDWLLNRHNMPYSIYYGIMCWIRCNGTSNVMTIGGSSGTLEKFPNGTRLKHSSKPNDIFIKIDNNKLYVVNKERYAVNSSVTHNRESNFIIKAETISPDNYSLADTTTRETWTPSSNITSIERVDGFPITGLTNNVRLWIPDGDCFFYYMSDTEKYTSEAAGVPSNGFISPCLTRYYTHIYRILTLDQPRSFTKKNLKTSRCYRKLSHALSTSPFIGEFATRALDCKTIKDIVNTYITLSAESINNDQEKTLLKTALKDISLYLQKTIVTGGALSNTGIYIDTKPSPYSLNNNLIVNKNQLFNKLITKYGASLVLSSGPATLTVNSSLFKDNTGVVITQAMDYYLPKNTTNSLVFNNQKIVYDDTTIQTDMSATESKIDIKRGATNRVLLSIPLYDIAKPDIDGIKTLFRPSLTHSEYFTSVYSQHTANRFGSYLENNLDNPSSLNRYGMAHANIMTTSDGENVLAGALVGGNEYGPELDAMDLVLNVRDASSSIVHEKYISSQMFFYWEKVSGPYFEFIENNEGVRNLFSKTNATATSRLVRLKIRDSGKYVVRCTINSPYGTFTREKTIYVYDGLEVVYVVRDGRGSSEIVPTNLPNPYFNKWRDAINERPLSRRIPEQWKDLPEILSYNPGEEPISLNRDNLRVRCSKFNRIAISQIGAVFVPINTGFTVRELTGASPNGIAETDIVKLDEVHKFSTKIPFTKKTFANLSITYNLESNTIAKISSIHVEKIRNNTEDCEQCHSLYEPKLRSEKSSAPLGAGGIEEGTGSRPNERIGVVRYRRTNKAPDRFSLYEYLNVSTSGGRISARPVQLIDFDYPKISTKHSPAVKTYGGYNNNTINSLNIENDINKIFYNSTIPGLQSPDPNIGDAQSIAASRPAILPPVTGFPLNIDNRLCYQQQLSYVGGGPITFSKGVLHPNSGWIPHTSEDYIIHANRSSVLKFNPGARSTFSFSGPKLSNIRSADVSITGNIIEPNTLSSSIQLSMSRGIQPTSVCACDSITPELSLQTYNNNQEHKEFVDTATNISSHGYRYLNGGQPKPLERLLSSTSATYNDEFGTNQSGDTFSYSFAVTGPASLPSEVNSPDGKKVLRIPTVQNFGIKDIEVKLNFLNYINTKNLVIWLEVEIDEVEASDRVVISPEDADGVATRRYTPIIADPKFLDQTIPTIIVASGASIQEGAKSSQLYKNMPNTIATYLDGLLSAEDDRGGGPLKLLLLNQEYIENNGYNFSVKFTDSASKYNVLYDQNIINGTPETSGIFFPPNQLSLMDKYQNIIRNNGTVRPSMSANSFSDRQSCEFSKILRNNRLNITAASFSKFNTRSLFKKETTGSECDDDPAQQDDGFGDSTKFTLKIMVLDETDDMSPHDTLINNEYLTGLSAATKTQGSVDIFNSLCNWELILHVGDVPKFIPHTNPNLASYGNCDALSLLDYTKNLKYPGYSFIADLTNYQHLLPLANIDAPNTAIADTSLCLTDKNDMLGDGSFVVKPAEFPSYAVLQIVFSIIPSTNGMLIGTATGPSNAYKLGHDTIINFLGEVRFLSTLQDASRQIYTQSYTKYPFGSPEKILLNVRKPDSLWYSLEATIMKYHNTPLLQLKKHNYVKVQRGVSKYATEFGFDIVTNYQELVDLQNIPEVSLSCDETLPFLPEATITYPTTDYGNYIINSGDLVNVTVTGCSAPHNDNGLYVTLGTGWSKITDQSIENLTKSISFLKYNSVLAYNNNLFYNRLKDDIAASRVIFCSTRIPYDIFFLGDTIECYSKTDRLVPSGESIINPNIIKKGLINKNNKLYSVFVLNAPITNQDTISPTPQTNTFLLYSNNTTIDNGIKKDYNAWGLDSNGYIKDTPPYAGFSAHSVGSYGNVSPFVNKNLLDKNFRYNSLQPTHKILNNQENDQIKKNKITVYNYNNDSISGISHFSNDIACGFSYNENDLYDSSIFQTKTSNVAVAPEGIRQVDGDFSTLSDGLFNQIRKTTGYNETNYSFMYLRTSTYTTGIPVSETAEDSNDFGEISNPASGIPLSGYISIENDYEEYVPIKFIELDSIVSRLETIDIPRIQESLENIVGDPAQTTTIINSSNIKYIEKHLKRLVEEDPSSCHRPGASIANCPKLRTQTKLNKLYIERTDLIKFLEQQAVQSAIVTYTDDAGIIQNSFGTVVAESSDYISLNVNGIIRKITKSSILNTNTQYALFRSFTRKDQLPNDHIKKLPPDILPKMEPIITTNTDSSINIQYSGVNLNHYWINIDPKQSCILDFNSNPKILDSTEYFCIPANPLAANISLVGNLQTNNNVCPKFVGGGSSIDGDEKFSAEGIGLDEYKYTIPFSTVDANKTRFRNKYPAITGWTKYTKERYFNINADKGFGGNQPEGMETTVRSKETYWVPLINNTSINHDNSADVQAVSGMDYCGNTPGSPSGLGLLGPDIFIDGTFEQTGDRVGFSTRVQNVFNLDNINSIDVQIKRIPRILRGCDLLGTVYRYGNRNIFRQQSPTSPLVPLEIDKVGINGPLNNGLYCWVCLQSTNEGFKYASLPPFLQHQNEMMFRSFFGSVDRIENRTDLMVSYYPWELIPYEYSAG